MNQQDVEQWIAQQGGSGRVQYQRSTQKVANPARQMTKPDGTDNPDYDPTAPATIDVSEEKWVAVDDQGKPTGAELHVRRRPDGDFDIVNQANANPSRPQAPQQQAEPPKTEDRGGVHYVWKPNPGGANAGGQWVNAGPAPLTPAERQAQEANAPTQTVRSEAGGDGRTYTVITIVPKPGQPGEPGQVVLGPDGRPAPGGVPGKAPTTATSDVVVDGTHYTKTVKQNPDGTVSVGYLGPDGKPVAALPTAGAVNVPSDAPTIDTSTPEKAHASFLQLYQWVDGQVRAGKYNQTQAKAVLEGPYQAVNLVLNREKEQRTAEQQRVNAALTQRGQDVSLSTNRLSNATSGFNTALADAEKVNLLADPGTNAAASVLLGNLALQRINAEQMGGLSTPAGVVPGPVAAMPQYSPLPQPASAGAPASPQAAAASAEAARQAESAAVAAANAQTPQNVTNATSATIGGLVAPPAPAASSAPRPAAPPVTASPAPSMVPGTPSVVGDTGAPPVPGGTKQMVAIDLGDETVYYDPTPDLVNAGGRLVSVPADRPNAYREPKAATDPSYSKPAPAAQPPAPDYGAPGMRVLPQSPPADTGMQFGPPAPVLNYGTPETMQPGMPVQVPGEAPGVSVPYPSTAGAESRAPLVYPTMALASTLGGGANPYDPAVQSLRAAGFSEEAIQEALRSHLTGAA